MYIATTEFAIFKCYHGNEYHYAVTCDENAEYEERKCVCRENYTGDGIICRRLEGEYNTQL